MRRAASAVVASLLALAGIVAACASPPATPATTTSPRPTATCDDKIVAEEEPPSNAKLPPFEGPMVIVQGTKMEDRLKRAGLDPKALPPFESLDKKTKLAVMKTFTAALGLACVGCHDLDDYAKPSPRKKATVRMWNDFVRVLAMDDGSPVYCDSCHQGSVQALDRRDKKLVANFMDDVFVGKLKRIDGKDHDCGTCHGDPPEFAFLAQWRGTAGEKQTVTVASQTKLPPCTKPTASVYTGTTSASPPVPVPVPVPVPAVSASASASAHAAAAHAAPDAPKTFARTTFKPAPRPASAAGNVACGGVKDPCPLQRWMRENMGPALAAKDGAALAKALEDTARFSPDASWTWRAMSIEAAAAAKSGDVATARKSCQGCHNAYKASYKSKFRMKPVR